MTSPRLRALRDYWLRARGARRLPRRADIDPLDIPRLLPCLSLIEVHRDPLRFRFRLIGTEVTQIAGRDATGRWLDDTLFGDDTERILVDLRECVALERPVAQREAVRFVRKDWIKIESLMLPLGGPEVGVEMLLNGIDIIPNAGPNAGAAASEDLIHVLNWSH